MFKNFLYLLFFIIIIASCNTKNDSNHTKVLNEVNKGYGQLIENDSLAFYLGTQLEDFVKLHPKDSFEVEIIENIHDYNQAKDTIRSFVINESKFKQYIYGDGNKHLIFAEIKKENKKIFDLVSLGNNKKKLSQDLGVEIKQDTVTIGNQDQTYLFLLYFDKEKLSRITFQAFTD